MTDTNQHYITKAYLDKFVHPDAKQAVLFPYRRGSGPCKARGTKRLGSAINFYRQRENGVLHDRLDEMRQQSETKLFSSGKRTPSAFANCIFEDDFIPNNQDKLELAAAAALLFCGSPVQIHNTAMHALLLHQMELLNALNADEATSEYHEKYGAQADEKLNEDRNAILDGKLVVDVGEENWKQLGFQSHLIEDEVIRLLLGMQMSVVNCNARSFFITSDNPVVRKFPSGYGKLDDEVWFPISYKRGLLWHRRRLAKRTAFGHSQGYQYNRRLIKNCYKFVFSPLTEDWLATTTRKLSSEPPVWGHYGSLREVIALSEPAIDPDGKPGEIVDLIAALKAGSKPDVVGI